MFFLKKAAFLKSKKYWIVLICFLIIFLSCWRRKFNASNQTRCRLIINLGNGYWNTCNSNGSICVPAKVPGGIYTDLRNGNVLKEDLYYRFNDVSYRWVAKESWVYSRKFFVSRSLLGSKKVVLVFDGLDTVAEVRLNGELVGRASNMFVRYAFDVKWALVVGENSLEVVFRSPVGYAEERYREQARSYPVPPKCVPEEYHGECHANHVRKMQSSFAWDWGPAAPSMGIWKRASLEGFDSPVLRDLTVSLSHNQDDNTWKVSLGIFVEVVDPNTKSVEIKISLGRLFRKTSNFIFEGSNEYPVKKVTADFLLVADEVDLWWPNGYGKQTLYDLEVSLLSQNCTSSRKIRIGFRVVDVVEEPIPGHSGLTFFVRVNGIKMFMKGSNWIPAHVLPEKVDRSYVEDIIQSAKEVHMNMIRVWGGGVYESDHFYNLADEAGILIWQDFMFACSMYPVDRDFLESVKDEVTHQIRRLQHHPCLALWGGNNENGAALVGNWYGTQHDFSRYADDYRTLYLGTIYSVVGKEDPTRRYLFSSPGNGKADLIDNLLPANPNDSLYGDSHYYNYAEASWNQSVYPMTRFCSEYGFQSFSSPHTLSKVSSPQDLLLTSRFTAHRQRRPGGNPELLVQIRRYLDLPTDLETREAFDRFSHLSQIFQAVALRTETEHYRRSSGIVNSAGEGLTMGALYWQLNEIWPGVSWSSLEFGGGWKLAHYYAKKFFEPVLLSPYTTAHDGFRVHLVNDLLRDLEDLALNVAVYKYVSLVPVLRRRLSINESFTGQSSEIIFSGHVRNLIEANLSRTEELKKYFLVFNLRSSSLDREVKATILLSYPKHCVGLKRANFISSVRKIEAFEPFMTVFEVCIETDAVVLFLTLKVDGFKGHFSENGFLLYEPKIFVEYYSKEYITEELFRSKLRIIHY